MSSVNIEEKMTVSGYAEYRGVSRRAVQLAIAAGRISKGNDGKIDRVAADAAWAKNTDASKPRASVLDNANTAKSTSHGEILEGASFQESRAAREFHLARIAKVEADEAEGSVIDIDDVKAAWSKVANELKTRLLATGSKAKSRIPHLTAEDVSVIDDIVRTSLGEVAECPLPSKR